MALCPRSVHVLRCLERFSQSSWTPAHPSPDRHMSLLHLHRYPQISASAAAETKALGRGIRECFVPVSSIFSPDKMKLSVQLEDGKFSPCWQAVNTFRNTRKHTKREKERSSSAFQVAASGHGSPSSNNPSKCCPLVRGNLTEEVRSYFGLHEVLFSIYQDLPGGSVPMCLGYVPVDKCHENCTSLLCSLKNLATRDEKQSSLLYLHVSNTPFFLSQTLVFLLCYFGHQNMLFVCIPISSSQIIFLWEKRICPLSWRS